MKGDAEPIYQAEDLKAGDTVKPPADPFREGYSFKGWLLDGEGGAWDGRPAGR